MCSRLTVRNTLGAVAGVGTLLLVSLAGNLWFDAWRQSVDARRALTVTRIEDAILAASRAWSAERHVVHVALRRAAATVPADLDAVGAMRTKADAAFRRALDDLDETGLLAAGDVARRVAETAWQRVVALRSRLDDALAGPGAARRGELGETWLQAATDLILASAALRRAARQRAPGSAEIRHLRDLKDAAWTMSEFAERESALIAGTIAAEEPLILAKAQALATFRGHLEEAWRYVATGRGDGATAPAIAAAIRRVAESYFNAFEAIRGPTIEAGLAGDDYPLGAADWRARADAAIRPVHALGQTVARETVRETRARVDAGYRQLVIASLVLLVTLTMGGLSLWIVVAWIVRPLGRITEAMTAVAAGEDQVTVPATDARGEIGEMARAVAVFKDAADSHAAEIRRANEDLEDRVVERTRALEQARDAAIAASEAKSQFLANMSHELRTPLTIIMSHVEYMREKAGQDGGAQDAEAREDLETILGSGRHLMHLIDEVLDLSKIEAGRIELAPERFDIQALAEDLIATVRPIAALNDNALELRLDTRLGEMRSDPTKLRQALYNLLSNACKFTHAGEIHFEVGRRAKAGADAIHFTVRDTGIGMSEAEAAIVFDAFTQADTSTTREYGGTGLGLTITREICALLDGEIDLESTPGVGTVFTLRLPTGLDAVSARTPEPAAPVAGAVS